MSGSQTRWIQRMGWLKPFPLALAAMASCALVLVLVLDGGLLGYLVLGLIVLGFLVRAAFIVNDVINSERPALELLGIGIYIVVTIGMYFLLTQLEATFGPFPVL